MGEELGLCSKRDEALWATHQAAFSLSPDDLRKAAGLLCGLVFLVCKMRELHHTNPEASPHLPLHGSMDRFVPTPFG